jgi:hypothetical protein
MAFIAGLYRRCGGTGLAALAFILIGILTLINALANRGSLSMDCAKYLAEKPNGKWVSLSGCVVSKILSVPKSTAGGSPTEVYVPIRAEGAKSEREIRLLLASDHASDLEFVKRANEQASSSSGRGMFRSSYGSQLEETRIVEGRVLRGFDLPDRERVKLTKTFPTLASDFVMIDARPRPGFAWPLTFFLLGCATGGASMFGHLRYRIFPRSHYLGSRMAPAAE